jgi:hypothetical protein
VVSAGEPVMDVTSKVPSVVLHLSAARWPRRHVTGWLHCLAVTACVLSTAATGQAGTIRVGWDRSQNPDVTGYVVYVGTAPGDYSDSYDVGPQTSLALTVPDGQRYYFAVASYANELEGPMSPEISGVAAVQSSTLSLAPQFLPGASPSISAAPHAPLCVPAGSDACYSARTIASGLGRVTAMTATPDGVRFIEDGRQMRVVSGGELHSQPALAVDGKTSRLTGLAVSPAFGSTGALFLGRADLRKDGEWELTVTRYRELRFALGEPATLISGLPLPPSNDSPIALDPANNIYLALPALEGRGDSRAAYNGFVLRFRADGTTPSDNRGGSPVLAYGHPSPTIVLWSALNGGELWLAGRTAVSAAGLARVGSRVPADIWPAVPQTVGPDVINPTASVDGLAFATSGSGSALLVAASGYLRQIDTASPAVTRTWSAADFGLTGDIVGVAAGGRGDVYLVVAGASFSVVRLQPQ